MSLMLGSILEAVPADQVLPASQTTDLIAAMVEAEIGVGTLVNKRYQIQSVLGQGGFGRTYLAGDKERFDELCVLKEFIPGSREQLAIERSRELFEREGRALYQLNHPQIPRFLAWFTHAGRLFLVQEYIDGHTYSYLLSQRLSQQGEAFSEAEIIQWLRDLLFVLAYLHKQNIVHRDISPDNIMLPQGQSQPVLIDFGLVKQTVSQIWESNSGTFRNSAQPSFVGKFGYSPPEQIRMGRCFPCSDLYALGVTAIVLLTGREPDVLMDQDSLEWRWHDYVKVSDNLAQILDKMLAEKPKDRYQSAQEVLAHLPQLQLQEADLGLPLMELQIEIDQDRMNLQVAEIEEMEFFQQLQQQAEELRNSIEPVETQVGTGIEATLQRPTLLESTLSWPVDAAEAETLLEAATPTITDSFIKICQHELAQCIGRMAGYIIEEALEQSPEMSPQQLVEALTAEIPTAQQAQFRKNVEAAEKRQAETLISTRPSRSMNTPSQSPVVESPQPPAVTNAIAQEFIDRCRQELSRCIGPMAKCIVDETLAENSDLSPQQFVEALAAEIPNLQQAQEFQQRLGF